MKQLRYTCIIGLAIVLTFASCKKSKKDEVLPTDPATATSPSEPSSPTYTGGCLLAPPSAFNCYYTDLVTYNYDSFIFTWSPVIEAVGYNVYRAEVNAYNYSRKAYSLSTMSFIKVSATTFPRYEPTKTDDIVYFYRITTLCPSGESAYSMVLDMYGAPTTIPETTPVTGGMSPVDEFKTLADGTGGKLYTCTQSSEIPGIIDMILTNHCRAGTDLVFLVDNTGSMGDDIQSVKNHLSSILGTLPSNTRVAAAYYRDNNVDADWYGNTDLTSDFVSVNTYIQNFSATGGGDLPESVFDGIHNTINNLSWRPSANKMIVVIGDAPPLTDPTQTQHSKQNIIDLCNSAGVMVNLYPILTSYISTGPKRMGIGSGTIQMRNN